MRSIIANIVCTMSGDKAERRLVEQQQARLRHQRARDRDHLLLAAGQRSRRRVELLGERRETARRRARATRLERAARVGDGSCRASRFSRTVMPVNRRRPSGTIAMPCCAEAMRGRRVRSRPSNDIVPDADRMHAGDGVDERGLARAVGTDDADELARGRRQRHVAQRDGGAVLHLDDRGAQACAFPRNAVTTSGFDSTRRRGAFRDDQAVIEHDDAVRQRQHRAHHVLDEYDRRAVVADRADQLDRAVDLAGREARQHLVEQQQPRPRRERARELEELPLVQVEVVGQRVRLGREARELEPAVRLAPRAAARRAPRRRTSPAARRCRGRDRCANGRGIW